MLAENSLSSAVVMTNGAVPVDLAAARSGLAAFAAPAVIEAPPAVTEAPPVTEAQERHRQSQKQLALLDEVAKMLSGLANADAPFQAAMVNAGLVEGSLAEWQACYAAAMQAVEARHVATVEALAATEAQQAVEFQARAAYSAFRQIARTVVTSHSGRAALKLDERTPVHREAFLRMAEAALTAARSEPYATLLGAATFGPDRLTASMAALDALRAAATVQDAAQYRTKQATAVRDAAMHDLAMAARQMRVEVKTLLRCNPQLTAPVGF